MRKIDELIEALQIASKYMQGDPYPTSCDHDVMYLGICPALVSPTDDMRLQELGFEPENNRNPSFYFSYKFGSY